MKPKYKVTITHAAVDTTYEKRVFGNIQVKRPESGVSTAILLANNYKSQLYDSAITKFDVVKIYAQRENAGSYTQIFGGTVRQLTPGLADKATLKIHCKGYGQALFDTHCNSDYGSESSHPAHNLPWLIWKTLLSDYVNKSLGSADNTGYALIDVDVENLGATIAYINNPYRRCGDVVNLVAQIVTAQNAGAASPHWFVDLLKHLRVKNVGSNTQSPAWPQWYKTNALGSTFEEGVDFHRFQLIDRAEEFANKVLLVTDFRRPSYDYWTEDSGGQALWGNEALLSLTDSNAQFVVGSHSLRLETNAAVAGYAYYPAGAAANWDVSRWGSERTIPKLSFYYFKDANITEAATWVMMSNNDTARKTDYYHCTFCNWHADPDNEWVHVSIPIGPYWATDDENRRYRWVRFGVPPLDWSDIDTVEFMTSLAGGDGLLYIDDLHFSGKIIREAKNSTSITANKEVQKLLISRTAMDDSCIATDDSGAAGRLAYAELLRRQKLPQTLMFTTKLRETMLPGVQLHGHAGKTRSGTFEFNSDCRALLVQHDLSDVGCATTVTASSDLTNSFPLSGVDQYALLTEYLLVNNREATDIRAGAEVDLLIPILSKDYP